MIVAGALVAAMAGWLAGAALNRLARWLPARREAGESTRSILSEASPSLGGAQSKDAAMGQVAPASFDSVRHTTPASFDSVRHTTPASFDSVRHTTPDSAQDASAGIFRVGQPSRHRELALQAATALVAITLWLRYGLTLALLPASVAGLLLLLIAAIDLDRRLVLNEVLIVGGALALLYAIVGGWAQLLNALLGGAVALGLFLLVALLPRLIVRSGSVMGVGDVKLAGLIGLLFGFPAGLQALWLGVIVGGLVSAALLLTRRLPHKATIPYAPFLAAGGILMLLLG